MGETDAALVSAQEKVEALVHSMLRGGAELVAAQEAGWERNQETARAIIDALRAVRQQEIGGIVSMLREVGTQLVRSSASGDYVSKLIGRQETSKGVLDHVQSKQQAIDEVAWQAPSFAPAADTR